MIRYRALRCRAGALFAADVIYGGELLDELHRSDIPAYIETSERLQQLPVDTVCPGHYASVACDRYRQILAEYLQRRRRPGCPSE